MGMPTAGGRGGMVCSGLEISDATSAEISRWPSCRRIRCWRTTARSSPARSGRSSASTTATADRTPLATSAITCSGISTVCFSSIASLSLRSLSVRLGIDEIRMILDCFWLGPDLELEKLEY